MEIVSLKMRLFPTQAGSGGLRHPARLVVADANPVARIADIDAGRVLVVDRHRRHFRLRLKRFVLLTRVELGLTLAQERKF